MITIDLSPSQWSQDTEITDETPTVELSDRIQGVVRKGIVLNWY